MMNLREYRRSTTQLADFLPWAALVDEGIVLNKDGSGRTSFILDYTNLVVRK
jgi:type IV secretory pathway VirB4 component